MSVLTGQDFEDIYQSTKARLLAIARRSVLCDADAEDVLHDAFARFFEKVPGHLGREEARRYLIRCVTNAAADWWRSRARQTKHEQAFAEHRGTAGTANPSEEADVDEELRTLHGAIARLPERQQQAIRLCHFGGMTSEEAATVLGCTPATVRSLLRHALGRLEKLVRGTRNSAVEEGQSHDRVTESRS